MAYAITANSIIQVIFRGKVLGQDDITVLNYKLRSPVSIDDGKVAAEQLLGAILGAGQLYEAYLGCKSKDYFVTSAQTQWVLATRHAYVRRIPTQTIGSVDETVLAPNTAFAIEKRTEEAGPAGRGILHMGGVPQSFLLSGALDGDGAAAYFALCAKLILPITTISTYVFDPVIVRKTAIATSPVLTAADVSPVARTMHRRTVGLGS